MTMTRFALWSRLLVLVLGAGLGVALGVSRAVADEEAAGTTLARIKKEGVLRWGADPSGGAPFAFIDPKDNKRVVGFEVDIVERLARHMGVRPELVRGDWSSLVDNLKAKRVDLVLNGLEVNDE